MSHYDSGVHRGLVADGLDAAVAALAYSQRNRSVNDELRHGISIQEAALTGE